MAKRIPIIRAAALAAACAAGLSSWAQTGQPHSLSASVNFSTVDLQWQAPASTVSLKWHDGKDYNGLDGQQKSPGGPVVLYAASKFTASDLKVYAGETVDSIYYFQYRNVSAVRVQIYENSKLVRDQSVDLAGWAKNTWKHVALDRSYKIPAGADVMFAVRFEYGANQSFVGITDRSPLNGKGNIYSYDGKNWQTGAPGDFLITAVLHNAATAVLDGYNVYRDGGKVNQALVTGTDYKLTSEADGQHSYAVGAVYGSDEKLSAAVTATTVAASHMLAPASTFTGTASELSGQLSWQAPLALTADHKLTWCNQTPGISIGGTSTSAPKVWVKQEFSASDMLACQGGKITAVNSYLAEAVKTATVFVMKNGAIDYYEVIPDSVVAALQAKQWAKFALAEPYALEPGNTYAFGVYYTHASGAHPIGVDSGTAINVKGNSFSTSSPSSTFKNSKPSWKALSAGNIAGNFMLTADIDGVTAASVAPTGYDVYRDGSLLASGVKATEYADEASEPGTHAYTLVTKYDGKQAPALSTSLTYTMPAAYAAPTIISSNFNDSTKQFDLTWSASAAELKHYGKASYLVGFNEDIKLLYGTKFQASELAPYAGYELKSVKFGVGEAIDSLRLEVLDSKGNRLASEKVLGSDIEAGYLYSMPFTTPVKIPAGEDLYLVYNATLPAGKHVMILDGGPLVDGGAMVSLTDGANWFKLGTVASDYSKYNIVIAATAMAAGSDKAAAPVLLENGRCIYATTAASLTINAGELRQAAVEGLGIDAPQGAVKTTARKASSATPKAKSYNVYCNGDVVAQTEGTEYHAKVARYGQFEYYVTTVYTNGWESPASKVVTVSNTIAQRPQAPCALTGNYAGGTLKLSWSDPDNSQVLTYQRGSKDMALGMTGSGERTSYCAVRFTADSVASFAGKKITHITFKLADVALNSASVIVMNGNDILYEQPVAVSDLKVGLNEVRLNVPYEIPAGRELSFGYHITYQNGQKPLVMDDGPSILPGYSDLLSASASDGYWYSLKTKFKQDYNWRISAILADADQSVTAPNRAPAKAAAGTTYNVYRDGVAIATAIEATAYDVASAANGSYTVTAVTNGVESAESNAVVFSGATAITSIEAGQSTQVVAVYGLNGVKLAAASVDALPSGVYLVKTADGKVRKVVK